MKRRNAEAGKMRRPIKRTKISEGMYGNSLLYLRFVMLWAAVILADYILEFRFEFLWPIWMMLKSVYDSFKYQGLAFSVFFICIAITSDVICFFFIPVQWIFVAASTYVWIQYVWFTVADKGICLPTVILCCALMYVEGAFRASDRNAGLEGGGYDLSKPFAAHCVGYPVVTLGFGVKSYVGGRLLLRRHSQSKEDKFSTCNGSPGPRRRRHEVHSNGNCHHDSNNTHSKAEKSSHNHVNKESKSHHLLNGNATTLDLIDDDRRDASRGSTKSSKCDKRERETSSLKEERKKNKNKDKDISDKSTEQSKDSILRENHVENLRENVKSIENSSSKDRERERENRELRDYAEELRLIRLELVSARAGEEEARRALSTLIGSEKQQRTDYLNLKQQHTALQHKVQTWRNGERASLERKLSEEKRARSLAEQHLIRIQQHTQQRKCNECENEWCIRRRTTSEQESASLRRELTRARDHNAQLQRDVAQATQQVRTLESRPSEANRIASAWSALQERSTHLERSLSAETRVKLDLLSALGEAKRQLHIQEGTIAHQDKTIDELKAQLLAVMPIDSYHANALTLRLSDPPLDPNASVYTPKQLCSDA